MKTDRGNAVSRVTVSIPADLFTRGEEERRRLRLTRSAYVRELYRARLEGLQVQERVARYAAAYAAQPADPTEDALTEASAGAIDSDQAPA